MKILAIPFIGGDDLSMSGKIIEFRHHHDLERAGLCTKQAVPRWVLKKQPSTARIGHERPNA